MQTTCPECRTTFRVSQEHLGARRGLVRCGTCSAVFNAYDTLLPELETLPEHETPAVSGSLEREHRAQEAGSELLVEAPQPQVDPAVEPVPDEVEQVVVEQVVVEQVEAPDACAPVEVADAKPGAADQPPLDPEPVSEAQRTEPKPSVPDILLEPLRSKPAKPPRTWKDWIYAGLAILLMLLLGLQTVYFLRAEIAAALPISRSTLEAMCRPLHCSVALPEQLTQAAIAASSLEHDSENKSRVRLTVLLANRTGQIQAWPQITLTLSDVRQAPVAQQVFRPQTYLPKEVRIDAGMAADLEREVRLDLDFGNLVASGYAVSLTYP